MELERFEAVVKALRERSSQNQRDAEWAASVQKNDLRDVLLAVRDTYADAAAMVEAAVTAAREMREGGK